MEYTKIINGDICAKGHEKVYILNCTNAMIQQYAKCGMPRHLQGKWQPYWYPIDQCILWYEGCVLAKKENAAEEKQNILIRKEEVLNKKDEDLIIDGELYGTHKELAEFLGVSEAMLNHAQAQCTAPRIKHNARYMYPLERSKIWYDDILSERRTKGIKERCNHATTLCWDCSRAAGKNMCVWALYAIPVPGWDADKAIINDYNKAESYCVKKCPQFVPD